MEKPENTPINSASTTKEVVEVKEFYKSTLKKIKNKIISFLSGELDEAPITRSSFWRSW